MIEIKKTDSRHSGHHIFLYCVNVKRNPRSWASMSAAKTFQDRKALLEEFNNVRNWCTKTWGPSCERTNYIMLYEHDSTELNTHWCWHTEFENLKLYLSSDKEVNWFKLKWL